MHCTLPLLGMAVCCITCSCEAAHAVLCSVCKPLVCARMAVHGGPHMCLFIVTELHCASVTRGAVVCRYRTQWLMPGLGPWVTVVGLGPYGSPWAMMSASLVAAVQHTARLHANACSNASAHNMRIFAATSTYERSTQQQSKLASRWQGITRTSGRCN